MTMEVRINEVNLHKRDGRVGDLHGSTHLCLTHSFSELGNFSRQFSAFSDLDTLLIRAFDYKKKCIHIRSNTKLN